LIRSNFNAHGLSLAGPLAFGTSSAASFRWLLPVERSHRWWT
jgi:hypothetical protein